MMFKYDVQLISLWTDSVKVNPIYHYLRQEVSLITKKLTNKKLIDSGRKPLSEDSVDIEVLRYQKQYPYAPALLALGAVLEQEKFSANYVSLDVERERRYYQENWKEDIACLICNNTKIAILISVVTPEIKRLIEFCDLIKKIRKDLVIIVGGVHATYYDQELLKCESIDIIIRGEGEETVKELIHSLNDNKDISEINGISYRLDKKLKRNKDRKLLNDLKSIPIPAYESLDSYIRKRIILTPTFSRGCPYGCSYCVESHFWDKLNRHKDPVKFVDELELLNKNFNKKFIHIADSTFGLDKEALEKFCIELKNRKLDCYFSINIRPDIFEYLGVEWVKRLIDLNFIEMCMGVESASTETIEKLKRRQSGTIIYDTLLLLKRLGLPIVKLYLMVGSPGDTHDSLHNTVMMINELHNQNLIFYATGKFFVPAPGTPLFNELSEKNSNWEFYERYNFPPLYSTTELTAVELESYLILLQSVQLNKFSKSLTDSEYSDFNKRFESYVKEFYTDAVYF